MKKNKIIFITVTCLCQVLCLLLLIFMTPEKVPLLAGIHDEIVCISSKWWMLIPIALSAIFIILYLIIKNKNAKLIFSMLEIFICYNNLLAFSFFCAGENFELGMLSEIPISVSIFLPLSLGIFVYGAIIKNIAYKNRLGLISKRTVHTEFIWKQAHITASYYYRLSALILFIVSIVFCFIHLPLIELAIFILGLLIPRILIEINAKKMCDKYDDMKKKHDFNESKKNNK